MKLQDCNFKTWIDNHDSDHSDISFRSLYPYNTFEQILFDKSLINEIQVINYAESDYKVILEKIELQENKRFRATFELQTNHEKNETKWSKRSWNERFQIVYTLKGKFITAFTKNEDSSKTFIKKFYKGNFERISNNKSEPVSNLLFKSLVSKLTESIFSEGEFGRMFVKESPGIRNLRIPTYLTKYVKRVPITFPVFSIERKIWLFYTYDEKDAHELAYLNCSQCEELYVIYSRPVYTKHHRCLHKGVHVLSLLEYIYIQSKSINSEYIEQVRFLQRNLELPITPNKKELRKEIHNKINKKYPIDENDLLEALAITKIMPLSKKDLRIFLASANLINSWLANQRINDKSNKLFRNMYYFKSYLAKATSAMISNNNYFESNLYIDNNLIMFEIEEYQYSFHSVPKTDTMKAYEQSLDNKEIIWSKKRLQPIASPIFQLEKST
ncbi:hypothetical protein N9C25_00165 [Saprospiraceae bacterium]|nr:hypothetical protein [Saprospiraceae bacterium]